MWLWFKHFFFLLETSFQVSGKNCPFRTTGLLNCHEKGHKIDHGYMMTYMMINKWHNFTTVIPGSTIVVSQGLPISHFQENINICLIEALAKQIFPWACQNALKHLLGFELLKLLNNPPFIHFNTASEINRFWKYLTQIMPLQHNSVFIYSEIL